MDTGKNKAPKGVLVAIGLIVLMIIFYFVITALFPELFSGMNTGEQIPVKDN
ncbi:hypothetical protein [uncultured Chryseobacterium sp.]|uniref:hypothetical protein n=1 Tax=uncultured Chryseobacterium sp. TaxID=259322 RepID=UPI00260E8482|nr:hypothetical protein [uncultured Chryseobacterium sp.]